MYKLLILVDDDAPLPQTVLAVVVPRRAKQAGGMTRLAENNVALVQLSVPMFDVTSARFAE